MSLTTTTLYTDPEKDLIKPDDIVAVHGINGRQEGLVVGSYIDWAGRQVIQVQLEGQVLQPWFPIARVQRVISYSRNPDLRRVRSYRKIYW